MKILGIDPGSHITGYGVIQKIGSNWSVLTYGCLRSSARLSLPERLLQIHQGLCQVIAETEPDTLAIENIFFAKNASSALKLGQTRGALIVATAQAKIPIHEYSPRQIKQAVTGYGQASKEQIQQMIVRLLKLKEVPTEDAADALAVALCHAHSLPQLQRLRAIA